MTGEWAGLVLEGWVAFLLVLEGTVFVPEGRVALLCVSRGRVVLVAVASWSPSSSSSVVVFVGRSEVASKSMNREKEERTKKKKKDWVAFNEKSPNYFFKIRLCSHLYHRLLGWSYLVNDSRWDFQLEEVDLVLDHCYWDPKESLRWYCSHYCLLQQQESREELETTPDEFWQLMCERDSSLTANRICFHTHNGLDRKKKKKKTERMQESRRRKWIGNTPGFTSYI